MAINLVVANDYCKAKGIGDPGLFHIKPMIHAEEEEMSDDEQKKSRLPRYAAEDDPVLDEPRSQKGEVPRHLRESPRASQWKAQAPWNNHRGMVERSNPRKGRHLHIKYPQLTSWPHLCRRDL